jgi:hypothetical protein
MLRPALRRVTAMAVIVFWTIGALGPLVDAHGGVAGDLACAEPGWAAPHPVTQFENVLPPVDDGHCALCHLQRAVRHAIHVAVLAAHHHAATPARRLDPDPPVAAALDSHLAPRAPPSL